MIFIIVLLVLIYATLQTPYFQKKITKYITEKVSDNLGLTISLSGVSISLWDSFVLENIVITNQKNDTILISDQIKTKINSIQFDSTFIDFQNIIIYNAQINLQKDKHGVWNINSFLEKFKKKKDVTSKNWTVGIHEIEIINATILYKDLKGNQFQEFGINFNNIELSKVNLYVNSFEQHKGSYSISIDRLSGKEKSGFNLLYFHTNALLSDTSINCQNVILFTPDSKIQADSLTFNFKSFQDFNTFDSKVIFKSAFTFSTFTIKDFSYFSPALRDNPYKFTFSGILNGKLNNFKGKKLQIGFGQSTRFIGDVEISGLPEISNSYLYINAHLFETTKNDISHTQIFPFSQINYIPIPNFLSDINSYSYKGNFTGFINDFVAYGTLTTDAGTINSDISISKSDNNNYNYIGDLSFFDFDLHQISGNSNLWGNMNSSLKIKGIFKNNEFITANVQGNIANIYINNYNYSNISIDGILSKQKFDGNLSILDPNIKLEFHGLLDYSSEIPTFNFTADVKNANLQKLNLTSDSIAKISFSSKVDFIGIKLDNIKGKITIPHVLYTSKYGTYETENIFVDIDNIGLTRNVNINSELLDLSINGKGNYDELFTYIYDFIKIQIPSLPSQKNPSKKTIPPNFNLSLRIKKIDSLLSVLYPNIQIAQNSYINTIYSEKSKILIVDCKIPDLTINTSHIQNIAFKTDGNLDALNFSINFDYTIGNNLFKENQIFCKIQHDSISFSVNWKNEETKKYEGNLSCVGKFMPSNNQHFPAIDFVIKPTQIYVSDSLWNIQESRIVIDSSSISSSYLSFGKNNQLIKLHGKVSENPNDVMKAEFLNYNLENLNTIIDNNAIKLEGALQGTIEISDFYHSQLIFANILSPSFSFNGHKMGKLSLVSQWIPLQNAIVMNISLQQGTVYTLKAIGTYIPSTKKIDYVISVKDLKLNNFKEFLESNISNLNGYLDGEITATGELTNPVLGGMFEIKRGKFLVNFTQTPYNFKGYLTTKGSNLVFTDLPISDTLSNIGLASGYCNFKNISNPEFSIEIKTDKLLMLNTNEKDNDIFYGQAFIDGTVKISGNMHYTKITAIGKTLQNTNFNIPLSYSELSANHDFLIFTDTLKKQNTKQTTQSSYLGTEVNLNITATPDALCQIIFDKQVGDIIKVRGNGNLQMLMNKEGDFTIFGDYEIEEGDYLFTLKSLINKKFIIEKGGTITFNGDPFDAQLNVNAKYDLKASVQPIIDSTSAKSYSKRIPVTCMISLQNDLMNPDITYDIIVPNTYSQIQDIIATFSSDEKDIQFLSLLLMNTFMSTNETQNQGLSTSASIEVLTSQLNNLLSQINPNFDMGVNYRPGDNINPNEVELALSRQFLNTRILVNVNGSAEIRNNSEEVSKTQSSDFAGNVNVEVKINKQGTFRAKGFSRTNTDPLAENQGNTEGIGLFFTREFNNLYELLHKK